MALAATTTAALASGLPPEILDKLGEALRQLDKFSAGVVQELARLQPGPWVRPEYILANGWRDSSTDRFVQFRRESGSVIRCEGRMTAGTVGATTPAFLLPPSWKPTQTLAIAITADSAFARVQVDAGSGAVAVITAVGNNFVDMNFTFVARTT